MNPKPDAHRVHFQAALTTGNRPPTCVQRRRRHPFDPIAPRAPRSPSSLAGKESGAGQNIAAYRAASRTLPGSTSGSLSHPRADRRQRDSPPYSDNLGIDPQQRLRNRQEERPGAGQHHPPPDSDPLPLRQRLRRTRAVHPRQVPPRKRQHAIVGTRRQHDGLRIDRLHLATHRIRRPTLHPQPTSPRSPTPNSRSISRSADAPRPDPAPSELPPPMLQPLRLPSTELHRQLPMELPTHPPPAIHQSTTEHPHQQQPPPLPPPQAPPPPPQHRTPRCSRVLGLPSQHLLTRFWKYCPGLASDLVACRDRALASADIRSAVHDDQAVEAGADAAEHAPRAPVARVVRHDSRPPAINTAATVCPGSASTCSPSTVTQPPVPSVRLGRIAFNRTKYGLIRHHPRPPADPPGTAPDPHAAPARGTTQ